MDIGLRIRGYTLQNALKFGGKPSTGAVIGKVLAEHPELKGKIKEISKIVQKIVLDVSKLSPEQQKKEIEESAPELLVKKAAEKRDIFSFLGIPPDQKITTAFPPGPEKYPHIGHAKALLLNHRLARQHGGRFLLRFEDTNPTTAKKEYYEAMIRDFTWLGVDWDEVLYASDFMDLFYQKAEELIRKGLAYIDDSSAEKIEGNREKGIETPGRKKTPKENLSLWKKMLLMPEGSAIVRLKIDLSHQNTTMRDPAIFRILDAEHPRRGKKYRLWPNYDFQNAIMDSYSNIDIRLRSKEFELRNELQRWIQEHLGLRITRTYEFGRFNLEGILSSGRIIREKIKSGELVGWDDPSLTTLAALRRRGFLPEAISAFVLSTGVSKAEATLTWDDLIMHNRRLLDSIANRYSALFDPAEVFISGAPAVEVELHLNPNEKKGGRKLPISSDFYLSKNDINSFHDGDIFRLMDCINVRKENKGFFYDSESYADFKGKKIINWLPRKDNIPIEVLMPDKTVLKGIAEQTIAAAKESEVVQFERFGFCRLDRKGEMHSFWFTHK